MSTPHIRSSTLASAARRLARMALVAATVGGAVACARNPPPDPNAGPEEAVAATTVRVQNQGFLDAAIYVVRGGARSRIGTVSGNSTAVLTIPKAFVQPSTQLQFIANPIGGRRQPVSQEVTVSPGDEVGLIIPPGDG